MFIFDITKDISSEILVIYALIALVVGLILVIIILDKKEKKRINMTKTQELRLMDLRRADDNYIDEYKLVEKIESEQEEIKTTSIKNKNNEQDEFVETIEIDDDVYVEDDLEKTSAQLRLEELSRELQQVQETQVNKISKFEAEQEENAIISYNELLKVSAKLYDENDKVQYEDEGDEPITLDQLKNRFSCNNKNNYSGNVEVL